MYAWRMYIKEGVFLIIEENNPLKILMCMNSQICLKSYLFCF